MGSRRQVNVHMNPYLKKRAEKRAEEKLVFPSLKLEKTGKPQRYEKLYQMKKIACNEKNCIPNLKDRSGKSLRKCKMNRDHVRMGFNSF